MIPLLPAATLALSFLSAVVPPPHTDGEDYIFLSLNETSIEGRFEINFDDLRQKLGLELDPSEEKAAADVVASAANVHAYINEHFSIGPVGGAPYVLQFTTQEADVLPKGTFGRYRFQITIPSLPDELDIRHSMFYEDDPWHRGLLCIEYNAKTNETYPDEFTTKVFSPNNREQTLDLNDVPTIMGPWDMIPQGVLHIWIGIDHILFLLALMLPTVLYLADKTWLPVDNFGKALWNLLKIVTVFTVAHSITLLLAALDVIALPSQLVESVIALSIIVVALNNILGKASSGSLWIILVLGLFHGLGFASVMGHLPFRLGALTKIVVGFNIGVELGQIAIVAVVFPLLFLFRKSSLYQPVVMKGVSAVLMVIAAYWFVQRAFGLE